VLHGRNDRIDLPVARPVVICMQRYAGHCPCRGGVTLASVPEGMEEGSPFSVNILALAIYLRFTHTVSYRQLIPAAEIVDSSNDFGGWYRAPGCQRESEGGGAPNKDTYTPRPKESVLCRMTESKGHHRDTEQKEQVVSSIFFSVHLCICASLVIVCFYQSSKARISMGKWDTDCQPL
jgi:hypothetical protein